MIISDPKLARLVSVVIDCLLQVLDELADNTETTYDDIAVQFLKQVAPVIKEFLGDGCDE